MTAVERQKNELEKPKRKSDLRARKRSIRPSNTVIAPVETEIRADPISYAKHAEWEERLSGSDRKKKT